MIEVDTIETNRGAKRKGEEGEGVDDEAKKKLRVPEEPSRSVYIGNLSPDTTYHDVCQVANHFGAIELTKLLPHKYCAFLNFVNQANAEEFYRAATVADNPIVVCGNQIKVGWAKTSPIQPEVLKEIEAGATRSLFVGSVAPTVTEEIMSDVFAPFGAIDSIIILRDKGIAFVNLTSVKAAINAKTSLATTELHGRRIHVNFAKESKGIAPVRLQDLKPGEGKTNAPTHRPRPAFRPPPFPQATAFPHAGNPTPTVDGGPLSRSLYLGNLHPETTYHDILPIANRFGAVEYAKIVPAKKCAFLNFVDDRAAQAFYYNSFQQLNIKGNDIRLGWAKSSPIAPPLLDHIRSGATRNLFVGNITEGVTEDMLKELFAPFGEFDSIAIMHQKGIAFVNMTSVNAAVTARAGLQGHELGGKPLKINYAKETVKFTKSS
jgi:RNA recognition motif-containing protein